MNLPHFLTEIIENISGDLSKVEQQAYYGTVITASKGKDLSVAHWKFFGSELRALPVLLPKHMQAVATRVTAGVDWLASGKEWSGVADTMDVVDAVYIAYITGHTAPHVLNAVYTIKAVTRAAFTAEATYIGYAVHFATETAFTANYIAAISIAAEADEGFAELAVKAATEKANIAYIEARQRQQKTLLTVIQSAPSVKDTEKGTTE